MADHPKRVPVWQRQSDDTFNWKDMFSWNSMGWYEAVLIGVWGALMGTGDYGIANCFFVMATLLFCWKWWNICHVHQRDRRIVRFVVGIMAAGLLLVVVIRWTSIKTVEASALKKQISKLDQIPYMELQISEIPSRRKQVSDLSASVNSETARRQQAEQDMKATVQRTGIDTRVGVIEDIKKSPIQVEINGAVAAPQRPLEAPSYRLLQTQCEKEHDDAPYCVKLTLQVDKAQPKVLVAFHMSAEVRYSRPVNLPGVYTGLVNVHPKDKTIFVVAVTAMGPVSTLTPDQSWIFFLSASSPIVANQLEVAPQN